MQTLKAGLAAFQYFFASSPFAQGAGWLALFALAGAAPFAVRRWADRRGKTARAGGEADGFIGHLFELRSHLMWSLCAVGGVFVLLTMVAGMAAKGWDGWRWMWIVPGAGAIYEFLAAPLLANLPQSDALIAIGVVSPFFVPMKAALFVSACAAMPFILREIWSFVAPGLYENEKRLTLPLLVSSAALFYIGVLFAYYLVLHVVFGVVASVTPDAVSWTPDIGELLGSMLLVFFTFGLTFEVPVAVFILVRAGVVELEALRRARPYVIVGAFVVAAIFTPPDVISQFMLAIPCWLLYEAGLLVTAKWGRKKESGEESE